MLSLLDRCLNARASKEQDSPLTKADVFGIIREMSNNLLTGYGATEREIASSVARICKKQSTFRFRMPNESTMLRPLHSSREEFNVIKLIEAHTGAGGSIYEFAYPYCVAAEMPTHYTKNTTRVCASRDCDTGEWISKVTTIEKSSLQVFSRQDRLHGRVAALDESYVLLEGEAGGEHLADKDGLGLSIGDRVTFLINTDGVAFDLLPI